MKILYTNVIEANAGWGAECFLNAALVANGHQTFTVDYRVNRDNLVERLKQSGDFDIFLLQRGDYFPAGIVRAVDRPKVFYFSELIARCRDADHLFEPDLFDHYFVRGPSCQAALNSRWMVPRNRISVLHSAFEPDTYRPVPVNKDIDVLFVGLSTPRRKSILDALSSKVCIEMKTAYGREACKLYNRAKIVLNIHAEGYLDTETRVYEVLGSKGFLLTEKLSDESPFRTGTHLVEVDAFDGLIDNIAYYLTHPSERERIAESGYQEAINKHTYAIRAREISTILESCLAGRSCEGPPLNLSELRLQSMFEHLSKTKRLISRAAYIVRRNFSF